MPRGRPCKCPYEGCGSTDTVSKGVRVTKTLGTRKIRRCKSCGRKFTPKNQRSVQTENSQADGAQSKAVDAVPPEDLSPSEPEESLPSDSNGFELTGPEEPIDGY